MIADLIYVSVRKVLTVPEFYFAHETFSILNAMLILIFYEISKKETFKYDFTKQQQQKSYDFSVFSGSRM